MEEAMVNLYKRVDELDQYLSMEVKVIEEINGRMKTIMESRHDIIQSIPDDLEDATNRRSRASVENLEEAWVTRF
ncbi:unnamed protein product [Arabis nemorensis]|uniref:Uncharacterized protein n=1 Tax=Arabis nemorensis TaxID=586526 RepID=A0A565AZ14_9BRAS|nr:unnamed protein product [Arabis nemorensis]